MGVALKTQFTDDTETTLEEAPPRQRAMVIDDPLVIFNREVAFARAMAWRFDHWLTQHVADCRIPLDAVLTPVTLLSCFVECVLVSRATWPELAPKREEEEYIHPAYQPRDEADAAELGLYPVRNRKGKKIKATDASFCLPGCAGKDADGADCRKLRAYGQRFCPGCETAMRARIRAWQA